MPETNAFILEISHRDAESRMRVLGYPISISRKLHKSAFRCASGSFHNGTISNDLSGSFRTPVEIERRLLIRDLSDASSTVFGEILIPRTSGDLPLLRSFYSPDA